MGWLLWLLVWLLVAIPVALLVGGAIRLGQLGDDPKPSATRWVERMPSPRPARRRRVEDVALVQDRS